MDRRGIGRPDLTPAPPLPSHLGVEQALDRLVGAYTGSLDLSISTAKRSATGGGVATAVGVRAYQ